MWNEVDLGETARDRVFEIEVDGEVEVVTWDELADANEPDTMAEIAALRVGQSTVVGQCDPVTRVR